MRAEVSLTKHSVNRAHNVTYVILFDIDGTLLSSAGTESDERRRYVDTLRDVVGKEPVVESARFAGMVDPQICRILLQEVGLQNDQVDYFLPKVLLQMGEIYRKMDKNVVLNDGVRTIAPSSEISEAYLRRTHRQSPYRRNRETHKRED